MKVHLVLIVFLLVSPLSFSSSQSTPYSEIATLYEKYVEFAKKNTDFEKEVAFFSSQKIKEINERLPVLAAEMSLSKEKAVALFMESNRKLASCYELYLLGAKTTESESVLFYGVESICDIQKPETYRIVTYIKEGVWKIRKIELTNGLWE